MNSGADNRRWPRQQVDFRVKVVIYDDSRRTLIDGRATELSEGGMTLYAGLPLQIGDLVEIEFEAPFERTVQAVIRYRDGFTFGLEFVTPLTS